MSEKSPWWKLILYKLTPFLFIKCSAGNYHWRWDKYCNCMHNINGNYYPVWLKPKSNKISGKYEITLTCSRDAVNDLVSLLKYLKFLGDVGGTAGIYVEYAKEHWVFDGDGAAQIGTIIVNGAKVK